MKTRTFGKLGWQVSEIGFGGWALGGGAWGQQSDDDSIAALKRALELGVNLIDTAQGYGGGRSEKVIAKAIEGHKNKVYLVTKTPPKKGPWPPQPHDAVEERYPEDYIRTNLEERLSFLNVDCLDVLLLHVWSRAWNKNPQPLNVLEKLKKEGKIRAFGISTPDHDQDQLNTLLAKGQIDVIQIVYNIFEQQPAAEALPLSFENGVAVMGRLVFDEGSLTGKLTKQTQFPQGDFRSRYFRDTRLSETVDRVEKIRADVDGTGYTMPQAAIQFALANPAVSCVIPGMRNVSQVESNVAAAQTNPMSEELLQKLYKHIWLRGNWHA